MRRRRKSECRLLYLGRVSKDWYLRRLALVELQAVRAFDALLYLS